MRLAKLVYSTSYVVDLDDKEMVVAAKICIEEDIFGAVKKGSGEILNGIKIVKDAKLKKKDIPSFLLH